MPSVKLWLKEIATYLALERLTYIGKRKQRKFDKVWKPFLEFLEDEYVVLT